MKTVVSLRELLDVLNSEHNERKGKTGKIQASTSKLNLWAESFIYRNSHPHCSLQWQIICFQVWPFNHVTWKSWSSCQGAGAIWFGDPWPHGQIGISTYGLWAIDLGHGFGAQVFWSAVYIYIYVYIYISIIITMYIYIFTRLIYIYIYTFLTKRTCESVRTCPGFIQMELAFHT